MDNIYKTFSLENRSDINKRHEGVRPRDPYKTSLSTSPGYRRDLTSFYCFAEPKNQLNQGKKVMITAALVQAKVAS